MSQAAETREKSNASPVDAATGIAERFRAVVDSAPDAIAVSSSRGTFTYAEIDRWSDAVARAIVAADAPLDRPVAIVAANNVSLIPAALGVVKAGHFYLTIDSLEPDDRIALLLQESGAALALADGPEVPEPIRQLPVIQIATVPAGIESPPDRDPNPNVNLVFTSGTTGKPKGIITRHAGFVAGCLRQRQEREVAPGDRVMYRSLPGFTRARALFSPLLAGATMCAFDARNESLAALAEFITRERLTNINLTPALFRRLLRASPPELDLSGVKKLRCGTDIVTVADVELFKKHFPRGCRWQFGYASSETGGGIFRIFFDHDTVLAGPLVPIGRPQRGVEVSLQDDDGNEVPPGVPGELVVTSPDVIEGYWNEPDLTSSRFVTHPDRPGVRTFRTGDLLMRDEQGLYYFVGRKDFRIRIHNRRIDPLQVESAMVSLPDVREAVVVGKPDQYGELHLVAYVVMREGSACVPRKIRAALRERLPAWMVPARIFEIDEIPATTNAIKVDRRALIARVDPVEERENGAADDLERTLVEIWSRVIGTPVHVGDDFFDDLGGESVVAAHLVTEVRRVTGTAIPLSMLLELNTVSRMAEFLRGARAAGSLAVLVQAGGTEPPLFCVTGKDGSVIKFRPLGAALAKSRSLYGLTFHGFDTASFPTSQTLIAACYLEAIRRIQPDGPYHVAGYSGGARTVLEIARQLERQGQIVALVGAIDAAGCAQRPSLLRRVANRVDMWRQHPARRLADLLRDAATRPIAIVRRQFRSWLVQRGLAFPKPVREANRAHSRVKKDYSTAPWPGVLTLFRARNGLGMLSTDRDAGWSRAGVSSVEVFDVRGDHNTMLTKHVDSLARAFDQAFANARARIAESDSTAAP